MSAQSKGIEITLALVELVKLAAKGDAVAIRAILDAAVIATECVRSIHMGTEGDPAREALHYHSEVFAVWPVLYNSMAEKRQSIIEGQIPPQFGTELPYRPTKALGTKSDRDFNPETRTGFTWRIMTKVHERMILAGKPMPHLSIGSLDYWLGECMAYAEKLCGGNWAGHSWPEKLLGDSEVRQSDSGFNNPEYAAKEAVQSWLKSGLNQLIINLEI